MKTAEVIQLQPGFEDFWNVWPRPEGKLKARVKFDAITGPGLDARSRCRDSGALESLGILKATPAELIAAAKKYRKRFIGKDYKGDYTYCQHAATWLNQGRWMDE